MVINAMHILAAVTTAITFRVLQCHLFVFFFQSLFFLYRYLISSQLRFWPNARIYSLLPRICRCHENKFWILLFSLKNMQSPQKRVFKASMSLSGIWWYLEVIFFFFPDQCINKYVSDLSLVSIEYIYVLYPLLLIFITWLCIELHARDFRLVVYLWKPFHRCIAKVRRNWSANDSVIHAYATFLLSLIYMSNICIISYALYNIHIQHQWHFSQKGTYT